MLSAVNTALKEPLNWPARSLIRNLTAVARWPRSIRKLRAARWAGLTPRGPDLLPIDDVPHEWLFPRMAAVVHHAGAGTTGAGVRAGVPAVAVPVMADQPFWAERLHRLGVGPPPVPFASLAADALARAITAAAVEPSYRRRAAGLADRIVAEDGAGAVLARIGRLFG